MQKIILALCCVFLFACKTTNDKVIPLNKMAYMLADVHIAENYASTQFTDSTSLIHANKNVDTLKKYYQAIMNIYNEDLEKFKYSYKYYKAYPKQGDTLYAKVTRIIDSTKKSVERGLKVVVDTTGS